ncbi:hypothetical protein VQL36_13315 [Chengkuizengella sp. SCS-71B]|uniref:hypothetical protein n=1 Tax=Chengkuizengella sp. SCS-71B TaxID=3115290 RepID=UPI0032C24148
MIHILTNKVDEGINYYLDAAKRYAKVDLITKESECLRQIMNIHNINKEAIDTLTVNKLEIYYDDKVKKGD